MITDFAPDPGEVEDMIAGRHGDPFSLLGMHRRDDTLVVNAFLPGADAVEVVARADEKPMFRLQRLHEAGFFCGRDRKRVKPFDYRLAVEWRGERVVIDDPYAFPPVLGELDEHLIGEGTHMELYRRLGAHPTRIAGVDGVAFAVWAPNARRVSVVGDFNFWDGRRHPMRRRAGIWEIFIPGARRGETYKYEILDVNGRLLPLKTDPVGFAQELPPATASIVTGLGAHDWQDGQWLESRARRQAVDAPISIYEVHPGSWRRDGDGGLPDYDRLAEELIAYAGDLGFTHIELLPITEHPFAGSWGYQPVGLFAPTRRFGPPEGFARFVDRLHGAGLGVIMDWVPAHFPSDTHGLARFDGTALYEHEDPRLGFHQDWNTLIYNFGRTEVANFLQASAQFWIEHFHLDALRVDAVASMLYLDYSRKPGEWIPNRYGGRENLEAVAFLQEMNRRVHQGTAGAVTIAEESTAWPGVSRPVDKGGLGFDYKWNMGWMHDTLAYMQLDPVHRTHHHHQMTFGIYYGFSENFVLPLSHDEVVHGKGSLIGRMPGDRWQKFANLRAYYGFMWGHPGKKLLFMGGEFAQEREWNHDAQLDWHLLDDALHTGIQALIRDLNDLYRSEPALHRLDCDPAGFEWVEGGDTQNSVFSFLRHGGEGTRPVLVVSNMTPVVRTDYRLGVPMAGIWVERLNTDATAYAGSGVGNMGRATAVEEGYHGRPASLSLTLPPLATLFLAPET